MKQRSAAKAPEFMNDACYTGKDINIIIDKITLHML